MNLEQHQGGMLECLGQMWTWVSGEAEAVVDPTTLHGWLEAAVKGRLHAEVKGRLHANAGKED
jgi:hypothetical protein